MNIENSVGTKKTLDLGEKVKIEIFPGKKEEEFIFALGVDEKDLPIDYHFIKRLGKKIIGYSCPIKNVKIVNSIIISAVAKKMVLDKSSDEFEYYDNYLKKYED